MLSIEWKAGQPALWRSAIYGNVAVHVESVHFGIAKVTVDGGESARQVIDHPELSEGWFVIPERLHKRPAKALQPKLPSAEQVRNLTATAAVALANSMNDVPTAKVSKRRLGLNAALNVAREIVNQTPHFFNWPLPSSVEEF